jgi:hypothetical protein
VIVRQLPAASCQLVVEAEDLASLALMISPVDVSSSASLSREAQRRFMQTPYTPCPWPTYTTWVHTEEPSAAAQQNSSKTKLSGSRAGTHLLCPFRICPVSCPDCESVCLSVCLSVCPSLTAWAPFSLPLRHAVPCRAMLCRALPCRTLPCRAVP